MILYNWPKIFTLTRGNTKQMFLIIKMLTNNEVPKNKRDPLYKYMDVDFSGISFLAHPEMLVYNSYKYSYREMGVYLALASARNLMDFKLTGDTRLSLEHCPLSDPNEHLIENRLLYSDDEYIYFLYEEVIKENTH